MRTASRFDPWPDGIGGIIRLPEAFRDPRGLIQNLTEFPCGGVAIIESKAQTERSNHWHRMDAHYLLVLSGKMAYSEWEPDASKDTALIRCLVEPGQCVYTPPRRAHLCIFLEDTVMVSVSKLTRTHEDHEADVVRIGG